MAAEISNNLVPEFEGPPQRNASVRQQMELILYMLEADTDKRDGKRGFVGLNRLHLDHTDDSCVCAHYLPLAKLKHRPVHCAACVLPRCEEVATIGYHDVRLQEPVSYTNLHHLHQQPACPLGDRPETWRP